MTSDAVTVFFSYSHKDEALRDELAKHLEILKWNGEINDWHDRRILPGDEWDREINENLNQAQVILLLVSSDFIASQYCRDIEIAQAIERHEKGEACVIPIILRPCMWASAPFGKLQALPKNAVPVTDTSTWPTLDHAFMNVAEGINKAVQVIRQRAVAAKQALVRQYATTYEQAIQREYPLSEGVLDKLKRLQMALGLSDVDVAPTITRLSAQYGEGRQKLEQYRKEVKQCLQEDEGTISDFSRSILDGFRNTFGLTAEEAQAIEQEELHPYQTRQAVLDQYQQVFTTSLMQYGNPLPAAIRERLQRFQQTLGLSEEDVQGVEERVLESESFSAEATSAAPESAAPTPKAEPSASAENIPSPPSPPASPAAATDAAQRESDALASEHGIDYTRLGQLLQARDWKAADYETYLRMLEIFGRHEGDWLRDKELLEFPGADLRTIDQLWVQHSDGRFGFSVQKRLYGEAGATLNGKYPGDEVWRTFCDRTGWRVNSNYINYSQATFRDTAPTGHLPACVCGGRSAGVVVGCRRMTRWLYRVEVCLT